MVVDTSAVIAILVGEPEAGRLRAALADVPGAVMSAATYVELVLVSLVLRCHEPG